MGEALLRRPDQLAKLQSDLTLVPSAIEEMLAWVTPVRNMNRTANRDTGFRGEKIREGDRLLLLHPSGNRDENVFSCPDEFDIERSPNHHLAFVGYGRRHCLGARLARLELRVLIEELLARCDVELLEPTRARVMRREDSVLGLEEPSVRLRARDRHQVSPQLATVRFAQGII